MFSCLALEFGTFVGFSFSGPHFFGFGLDQVFQLKQEFQTLGEGSHFLNFLKILGGFQQLAINLNLNLRLVMIQVPQALVSVMLVF